MKTLLDVVNVAAPLLPINVLSQLACASKTYAIAVDVACTKKMPKHIGKDVFDFVKAKHTTDERSHIIAQLPLSLLTPLFQYIGDEINCNRYAFSLNSTEIGLSVEFSIHMEELPQVFNVVFDEIYDFVETVEFDDFFTPEPPTRVMLMAIKAFDAFAETLIYKFSQKTDGHVGSFDWVAHNIGLVQLDFDDVTETRSKTIAIRRSQLPFLSQQLCGVTYGNQLDMSGLTAVLSTMFEFIPV